MDVQESMPLARVAEKVWVCKVILLRAAVKSSPPQINGESVDVQESVSFLEGVGV